MNAVVGTSTPDEAGCHVGCVGSRQSIVRQWVGYACDAGFYSRYPLNIDLNIVVSGDMFRNARPAARLSFNLSLRRNDCLSVDRLRGIMSTMFQRSKGPSHPSKFTSPLTKSGFEVGKIHCVHWGGAVSYFVSYPNRGLIWVPVCARSIQITKQISVNKAGNLHQSTQSDALFGEYVCPGKEVH